MLEEEVDVRAACGGSTQRLREVKQGKYSYEQDSESTVCSNALAKLLYSYLQTPGKAAACRRCFFPLRYSTGNDETLHKIGEFHYGIQ